MSRLLVLLHCANGDAVGLADNPQIQWLSSLAVHAMLHCPGIGVLAAVLRHTV